VARRYKTTTPASVELALGLVAAVVWGVGQLVGWLRLLVATLAAVVVLGLTHTAVAPVRGAASFWGPTEVLAPGLPTAALVVGHA